MARNVNFDLSHPLMEARLESPVDEDSVHHSFDQLLAEQSQTVDASDAFELQQIQRDLDKEGQDHMDHFSGPGHDFRAERQGRRGEEWVDEERQANPIIDERWCSATMKILSSMPSRTIGRSRGAIISQYYNRTLQLRRRKQSRPNIQDFPRTSRPSIRGYGIEADATDSEVTEMYKKKSLVNNLQNLSVRDRVRMLRGIPLRLAEKRDLRLLAFNKEKRTHSDRKLSCCSRIKYDIIFAVRQSWYSWLSFLQFLRLWQVNLKRVSGRFGTGVLSYFLFLRTLLFFNLFLLLVTFAFLVLPQALHHTEQPAERPKFSGLELVTGSGYFTDTVMYYGYYSNSILHGGCKGDGGGRQNVSLSNVTTQDPCRSKHLSYNMPLAYFFTIGMAFFITCIILVYSMSKSFGQSFTIDNSYSALAMKVFCSWDFKVIKKTSVMSENICTQLKELLAELNHNREKKTMCKTLGRLIVHGLAWVICLSVTTGCVVGIYVFSEYMHKNLEQTARMSHPDSESNLLLKEASLLALPVLVSIINLLLPGLFNFTANMEEYDSPSVRTYVSISRNLILKVSVLGILCYHWLGRVAANPSVIGLTCWESFVGQELYRFLLVDFIFTLLDTFFGEFLWRFFFEKVLKKERKPVFDIARNVLDLIYGQTLSWLGVLFSPILPAVQILKLFLLFYLKKSSVMMNCQAPRKPYRASQMTTIFITLLCFPSFIGASVCVTYTMWSLKPSSSCGPFQGLNTMFQAGKRWMELLEEDNPKLSLLARAHTYLVENPFFLFVGAGIFLIVIYFHSEVVDGHRKIINLLQEQIQNEGEDKKFLIARLQSIHEEKRTPARRLRSQESAC
ncbi:transmembrane channel-like protein 6b [Pholidichthys leucotaenia]